MSYARGKKALGVCDQCGFTYKLNHLKYGTLAGRRTKAKFCPDCWDPDDPKDRPAIWTVKVEAIGLREPRPDTALAGMNSLGGWNPVLGFEIPVSPSPEGWNMLFVESEVPRYVNTEDLSGRLLTESGQLIWAEE